MHQAISGIVPPLITPLTQDRRLDESSLERVIEHILKGGVHGLFSLGTTGEFASLSEDTKRAVVSKTCQQVAGRVPVLVGVTHTSQDETLSLAQYAADQGAAALVLSTPYYFNLSANELKDYLQDTLPRLPLPVYLYNIPVFTKVQVDLSVLEMAFNYDNVVGYKDSSGNMLYFHQVLQLMKDSGKSLLMGPEELMADAVLMGAQGGVCGGANLFPAFFVRLYERALAGDLVQVREMQAKLMQVSNTLYRTGAYGSSFIKSLKSALEILGLCESQVALPFRAFDEAKREVVKAYLQELNIQ